MEMGFSPAEILIPKNIDMSKWSVVACDQYTSEPEYWADVTRIVGASPSTLHLVLPELYLNHDDVECRIRTISHTMENYLAQGLFQCYPDSYVYLERRLSDGSVRQGLVGALDLEQYSYLPGAESWIRATEGTILERIPPRMKVREQALLELPHVMVLLDDPEDTVLKPLAQEKSNLRCLYHFPLMKGGGQISGYLVDGSRKGQIEKALSALADPTYQEKKYNSSNFKPFLFAVGDGNHSLATAKACFEQVKKTLPEEQWKTHPARYALVELVNLHGPALHFEPIHRVVFQADPPHLLNQMEHDLALTNGTQGQSFTIITAQGRRTVTVGNPSSHLAVGTLQTFLDGYLKKYGGNLDYIHGEDAASRLGSQPGNITFLLPVFDKQDFFRTILLDGAFPRKTFSMGHAYDKRYYLECRKIK